ncbi:YceI family protein [Streptomyces sp. NPDC057137]|uniref:YceI family protein n=1 Tax=Streptomyces sp. NPDC057137 TaxID=3346030 RepID=UPI0036278F5B
MTNDTTNPTGGSVSATDLATGHWVLDPAGSSVGFRHKSLWGLVTVRGTFATVTGEGQVHTGGRGEGTLVIDATSVDTKKKRLDVHLRSADFFEVDRHPTIVFAADGVIADSTGNAEVSGVLTVRGKSRPLTFTAQVTAASATDVTLTGEVGVDYKDFGLPWKNPGGTMRGITTVTLRTRFTRA